MSVTERVSMAEVFGTSFEHNTLTAFSAVSHEQIDVVNIAWPLLHQWTSTFYNFNMFSYDSVAALTGSFVALQ